VAEELACIRSFSWLPPQVGAAADGPAAAADENVVGGIKENFEDSDEEDVYDSSAMLRQPLRAMLASCGKLRQFVRLMRILREGAWRVEHNVSAGRSSTSEPP
jgi:hypothetical protein